MASSLVSLTLQIPASELPALMALAAKSGVSISAPTMGSGKVKKVKKEKDPLAPKKEANDWIRFTQRARAALLAGGCELKGFIGQQYCATLKERLPMHSVTDEKGKSKDVPDYDSISDEDILAGFKDWTPPEQSMAAAARSSKASSAVPSPSDSALEPEAAAPAAAEAKPKRQWSEAAKAAAAEKRAATKAAKAAGAEAAASPKPAASPKLAAAAVVPKPVTAKPAAKPQAPKPAAPAPAPVAEEGDITEFAPCTLGGVKFMRNCRGDILSLDYEWVGRLEKDGKTINKKFEKPADLEE